VYNHQKECQYGMLVLWKKRDLHRHFYSFLEPLAVDAFANLTATSAEKSANISLVFLLIFY
jgi:hypothetical protein